MRSLLRLSLSCCLILAATTVARAMPADLTVTRATLANGLRVVVVRDPLAPVVTAMLNYEVGSNDQRYAGQAHALEHMMFRGSETVSQSQLSDIDQLLGGNGNADTQAEVTQYFSTAPSQYLDLLLRLEASRAKGLSLRHDDWAIERGAIENEVTADDSNPLDKLYRKVGANLFAGTPYGNDGLGTLQSFDREIDTPQLRALYDAYYHPNNAIYVIVGDVDPAPTIAKVRTYFGGIPSATLPARPPVALQPLRSQRFTVESDAATTTAALVYRFPGYASPDYAAGQILEGVLSNERSDLYGLVARGAALSAKFEDFETHPQAGSAMADVRVPIQTDPDAAVASVRAVLDGYRKNGVPATLVEAEKRRAIAAASYKANSIVGLAFAWSQALAVQGLDSPDDSLAALGRVTVADVDRVLRRYVDPQHEVIAIAAPERAVNARAGAAQPAAGGGHSAGVAGGSENSPTLLHHDPLPAWARSALETAAVPPASFAPVDRTLSNGVRLVVVPENVSDTVVVRGSIATNEAVQAPPGLDGIAEITSALLPYGTTTYDRLGLRAQLDAIAADVEAGTTFSLTARAADLDRGVSLLADEELHPAFPAAAFASVARARVDALRGVVVSPARAAEVVQRRALFPASDPAQRFPTPESAARVTRDAVEAYYRAVYRPDLTTVVVIGRVDPEHVRALFEREFGAWRATGPKPDVAAPSVPRNASASFVIPDPQRVQAQVRLVEVLPFGRADADYPALSVANAAFGGSAGAILFHDVRDVHGLVYGVSSRLSFGKNRSIFAIESASDPGKIEPAQALIESDLRALGRTGLGEDDLLRGRTELVSRIPTRAASFTGIAKGLIENAEYGLPLDQTTIDARNEFAVTNAQVRAAVAKWLRPDGFVRVIVGPGPT
ncbi:MAG: hypothetical protein NVS2B3_09140 [Vulcanimicrobiaceae bacterium]